MKTVIVLQHIDCETPGILEEILKARGFSLSVIHSNQNQPVPPKMGEAAGLLVMGGPMGVYEEEQFPFIRQEIRLIQEAVKHEKPVLGICLGSQLLAASLGARVYKGKKKEIGWLPVRLIGEGQKDFLWNGHSESFVPLHWHGDIFELPQDAVPLASSELTHYQAFRFGKNAYGFLFHLEVTEPMLREWVRKFSGELRTEKIDGRQILKKSAEYLPWIHNTARTVFSRWADLI
ncbi:MAG TPA: gamma-glutamyl-gamma-aminobutyrate hydrolase family protein [bacterium]|nr:gamma-glutamyl-gamma-aminobutyrate hydrolase family protein [bacterium]